MCKVIQKCSYRAQVFLERDCGFLFFKKFLNLYISLWKAKGGTSKQRQEKVQYNQQKQQNFVHSLHFV